MESNKRPYFLWTSFILVLSVISVTAKDVDNEHMVLLNRADTQGNNTEIVVEGNGSQEGNGAQGGGGEGSQQGNGAQGGRDEGSQQGNGAQGGGSEGSQQGNDAQGGGNDGSQQGNGGQEVEGEGSQQENGAQGGDGEGSQQGDKGSSEVDNNNTGGNAQDENETPEGSQGGNGEGEGNGTNGENNSSGGVDQSDNGSSDGENNSSGGVDPTDNGSSKPSGGSSTQNGTQTEGNQPENPEGDKGEGNEDESTSTSKPEEGEGEGEGSKGEGDKGEGDKGEGGDPDAEIIGTGDGSDSSIEQPEYFNQTIDFVDGMDGANMNGLYFKTDNIKEVFTFPANDKTSDSSIIVCMAEKGYKNVIFVEYPALQKDPSEGKNPKGSITFLPYSPNKDLIFSGLVRGVDEQQYKIFDYIPKDNSDILDADGNAWETENFILPRAVALGPWMLEIIISSASESQLAMDEIHIEGFKVKSEDLVMPPVETTVDPNGGNNTVNNNATTINNNNTIDTNGTVAVNCTDPDSNCTTDNNSTVVITPDINNNDTVDNNSTTGSPNGTTNGTAIVPENPDEDQTMDPNAAFEEHVNRLAGVAQAIWDAFYVFLALFCACLVALVALIVRGRCNSDSEMTTTPLQLSPPTTQEPPPTASTRSTITPGTTPMQYERGV